MRSTDPLYDALLANLREFGLSDDVATAIATRQATLVLLSFRVPSAAIRRRQDEDPGFATVVEQLSALMQNGVTYYDLQAALTLALERWDEEKSRQGASYVRLP